MKVEEAPAVQATFDIVIVGAGFAGLYMLYRARSSGLSACVVEAGEDVGGTWYWNRYPGARCDVESIQYSYSFDNRLQQDWHWPDRYAIQPDIQAYIAHVADRFDLRKDIRFNTRVVAQRFDEATRRWEVSTDRGDVLDARFCVMATGNLTIPAIPEISGLDSFQGRMLHASQWPKKGVDFTGKRVALIGTGATGVQLVPQIAATAEHLYVLQRTPNFSIPAENRPLTELEEQEIKARYRQLREEGVAKHPFGLFGIELPTKSALEVTPEEREQIYEKRWQMGGSINFLSAFNDLLTNKEANETAANFVRAKIRATVADPATAELLCPKDHPIGSKRLCLDTDYYVTYNRANVTLVDIKKDPIAALTPGGIRTGKQDFAVDIIVFATGYDAVSGALLAMDVTGRGGLALRAKWANGPATYLGLMTAGFPNMFIVTGAGSPSVKSNMVGSIEQHVDWIADCIAYMAAHDYEIVEADPEAERGWAQHVNELAEATLYVHASSWYFGSNVPGKARFFAPYIGGVPAYRAKCNEVVALGYRGFRFERAPAAVDA